MMAIRRTPSYSSVEEVGVMDARGRTDAGFDTGLYGIRQVARELGITERALRFYEDKGLIEPARVAGMRIYSRREIGRMRLILRGKRLGFSIGEIKEFLDLYDIDPSRRQQMSHLAEQIREHLDMLEAQREALELTITELCHIEREVKEWIAQ